MALRRFVGYLAGGGRQVKVDIWCDMLLEVLSTGRSVKVDCTVVDTERLRQRLCELRFHVYHSFY